MRWLGILLACLLAVHADDTSALDGAVFSRSNDALNIQSELSQGPSSYKAAVNITTFSPTSAPTAGTWSTPCLLLLQHCSTCTMLTLNDVRVLEPLDAHSLRRALQGISF
jgi:hypothetical protein